MEHTWDIRNEVSLIEGVYVRGGLYEGFTVYVQQYFNLLGGLSSFEVSEVAL